MFHLNNISISLILLMIFTILENYNSLNITEQPDEYDKLERLALFEKINWMIKEVHNIRQEFGDFYISQNRKENKRLLHIENMKSELKQVLNQLLIRTEKLVAETKQDLTNNFLEQKKFIQNNNLALQNLTQYGKNFLKLNRKWQTILRRQDALVDFNRSWLEYKLGFGDINGNFFIGLDALHAITTYGDTQELLIVLQDFNNETRYAKYSEFVIGSENEKYMIKKIGNYQGDAGDSFFQHSHCKFSTYDQDNDNTTLSHCAEKFQGGWWFSNCYTSYLTGVYLYQPNTDTEKEKGLVWRSWHGLKYSLKYVELLIRPKL